MNADGGPAFLDTNVFVYAQESTSSVKQSVARELIARLVMEHRLRISTQVLQELFYTLIRKAKKPLASKDALAYLDDLAKWQPLVNDFDTIRRAAVLTGEASISFWDALIVVAASRSGARTLYTEDLNHGQEILGVRVVNPFHGLTA
jgi:predicted nucleic acid-binding protein